MKVGILTFHWSNNYGAALQTYALKTYLQSIGIDAFVIDYHKVYPKRKDSLKNKTKNSLLKVLLLPYKNKLKKQKDGFNYFRNTYFNLTKSYNDISSLDGIDCDYIFCGSDQIWNSNLTGDRLEEAYFANFKTPAIKVAYAASIGEKILPQRDEKLFEKLITNFDYISVRESQLVSELKKYTDKEIKHVLDPTLLLDTDDYIKIASKKIISEPYLLIYQNTRNNEIYKIAKEIAKKRNLKIYEVGYKKQYPYTGVPIIQNAGPQEFLSLYQHAEYIVTNTFHGTVFAIQFKKQFVSIPLKGRESRVVSLANILNIEKRLVKDYNEYKEKNIIKENIKYDLVYEKLNKARLTSKAFIENLMKGNSNE